MHEAVLASAALPPPAVVFGLLLRPYSLGHELFLIRENNPLARAWEGPCEPVTRTQLAEAALICCQGFAQNRRQWRDRLIGLKLRLWRWRTRRLGLAAELARFVEYQVLGTQELALSPAAEAGEVTERPPGAPFILRLHQFLTMKLRLSQAAAWDYPYGLAVMQWETAWETRGALRIMNRADAEHLAYVAKMEQEATCQV